ncbi:MAG: glycosyltransferase, partial [Kineosporiaceae bacterium]
MSVNHPDVDAPTVLRQASAPASDALPRPARAADDLVVATLSVDPGVVERAPALAGRHVVVVGINYAPEPTGIAPYTTGMAEHLAASARSVTVLTGVPHYPNWRVPPAYRWMLRCREESRLPNDTGLLVHRMRHYVPSRQNALTRAGYEVSFLANAATKRLRNRPDLVIAVTPSLGGAVAAVPMARRHGAKLVVVVQDL